MYHTVLRAASYPNSDSVRGMVWTMSLKLSEPWFLTNKEGGGLDDTWSSVLL